MTTWPQPGNRTMTIDISKYQKDVNWDLVKNIPLVALKSTEGNSYKDPLSKIRHGLAQRHGMLTQWYHFFHPLDGNASQLANMFAYTGPLVAGDLPPALDVEWTDGLKTLGPVFGETTLEMLQDMEQKYGKTPWLYTNAYFFMGVKNPSRFARFPLWLNNLTTHLVLPEGCTACTSLQFTDSDNIPGIGICDASWFSGTPADLKALAVA